MSKTQSKTTELKLHITRIKALIDWFAQNPDEDMLEILQDTDTVLTSAREDATL